MCVVCCVVKNQCILWTAKLVFIRVHSWFLINGLVAANGRFRLLLFIFLFFRKELPHDILCTSRSDDNRRAAGAAGFIRNERLFLSFDSLGNVGSAARLFGVFCGKKLVSIRVHSWF